MTFRTKTLLVAAALAAAPLAAQADEGGNGGDREAAGGAFNSSYSRGPYAPDRRYPQAGGYGPSAYGDVATGSIAPSRRVRRSGR